MKVYVVQGSTGEYSDHMEWFVAAFLDEDKARAMVEATSRYAPTYDDCHSDEEWHERRNPYDPNMRVQYTGVRYYYEAVNLLDDVPVVES